MTPAEQSEETEYRGALRRLERIASYWRHPKQGRREPVPSMLGLTWLEYATLRNEAELPARLMGSPS